MAAVAPAARAALTFQVLGERRILEKVVARELLAVPLLAPVELVEAESSSFTTPQAVPPHSLIQWGNLSIEPLAQSP
jgi:hypothetical protein